MYVFLKVHSLINKLLQHYFSQIARILYHVMRRISFLGRLFPLFSKQRPVADRSPLPRETVWPMQCTRARGFFIIMLVRLQKGLLKCEPCRAIFLDPYQLNVTLQYNYIPIHSCLSKVTSRELSYYTRKCDFSLLQFALLWAIGASIDPNCLR